MNSHTLPLSLNHLYTSFYLELVKSAPTAIFTIFVLSFPIPVRHYPSLPDPPFTVPVLNKSPRQAHIAPCAVRGAEPLQWWKARVTRWKEIKLKVDIVICASIARSAITITEKHLASSIGESDVVKKSCLQKWVPDSARNSPKLLQNDPGLPGTFKKEVQTQW